MKSIVMFIFMIFLLSSCSTNKHYYQLTDGKWVSKRQFNSMVKKCIHEAVMETSKEDLELISGMTIDTISKKK